MSPPVSSNAWYVILCAAVGAIRLIEMTLSRRHQRALAAGGSPLLPERAFGAMVALHTGVIAGAAIEVVALHRPFVAAVGVPALVALVLSSLLRWWVIATLGVHWNVRVVRSTGLGVVTGGPYRFVRHPNYVAVFVELMALPLVHGAYLTAAAGTILHVLVLNRRVTLEESVLMADDRYRRAFADKPRFLPRVLPWPTR
ncbi:MAG TPA: isoprenylcysteine carboxylmethyltransferase family protein [Polyangia bacterium]|nr:isoprenylcysteine carboxylmethyltransferase family protein [Polyangia bacterium]